MVKKSTSKKSAKKTKSTKANASSGEKKLARSRSNKLIAGVCGGFAEYFGTDAIWVRIGWIILTLLHGIGLVLYIICWIIMPENEKQRATKQTFAERWAKKLQSSTKSNDSSRLLGAGLLILGAVLLLRNFFDWIDSGIIWAVVFIFLGVYLIKQRTKG